SLALPLTLTLALPPVAGADLAAVGVVPVLVARVVGRVVGVGGRVVVVGRARVPRADGVVAGRGTGGAGGARAGAAGVLGAAGGGLRAGGCGRRRRTGLLDQRSGRHGDVLGGRGGHAGG